MIRSSGVSIVFILCYEREMRMFCAALSIYGPVCWRLQTAKISHNKKNHNYVVVATSGQLPLTSRKLSPHTCQLHNSRPSLPWPSCSSYYHTLMAPMPPFIVPILSSIIQLRYVLIFGGQDNRPFAAKSGSARSPPSR